MTSIMAQKSEFIRYNNEFSSCYDSRRHINASYRDKRPSNFKSSNIICFRCKGNHHVKDCNICAYCKDIDNPHHVDFCPKANYCHYCKDIVGHNIKRCPYLNKCPIISQPKIKKPEIKFSFDLLSEDCPELPKSTKVQSVYSDFSIETKQLKLKNEQFHKKFTYIFKKYKELYSIIKIQRWWINITKNTYDDSIYTDSSITEWDEQIDWDNASSIKIDFLHKDSSNDSWW